MEKKISLIALDMDGTLFNNKSQISDIDGQAIRTAIENGIEVVISTGRPYVGLPQKLLQNLGIRYAITANGAAIYRLWDKKCLYSNCMPAALVTPIIQELQKETIHIDAFIQGDSYSQNSCKPMIDHLDMPVSIREYIKATRIYTDDLVAFIQEQNLSVQKMTLNFCRNEDGVYVSREAAKNILRSHPEVTFLSGGYHNLEFTRAGTTKGKGLLHLCELLGISIHETMACGDTSNDIDILRTAEIGVAMANATEQVKEIANYTTRSNEEYGVAHAISHFTNLPLIPDASF